MDASSFHARKQGRGKGLPPARLQQRNPGRHFAHSAIRTISSNMGVRAKQLQVHARPEGNTEHMGIMTDLGGVIARRTVIVAAVQPHLHTETQGEAK